MELDQIHSQLAQQPGGGHPVLQLIAQKRVWLRASPTLNDLADLINDPSTALSPRSAAACLIQDLDRAAIGELKGAGHLLPQRHSELIQVTRRCRGGWLLDDA
jgi:hypothetical protein